jgi:hypothetical protein
MSSVNIDLSGVYRAIDTVNYNIGVVNNQVGAVAQLVDSVAQEQANTRQRIDQLLMEFLEYIEKDQWANEVSTARQELTLIRQELDTKFGHYEEVRKHATGILQATDVAIVREETVRTAAESLMLSTPGYWLAPALVALSAWISDNQPLAERALAEAAKRHDSKSSLFFALVCRRARRMEPCGRWLIRYFQLQNPFAMDREVAVMLDSLANGVFGGAALTACSSVIDGWLGELEEQVGFLNEQRKRWAEVLDIMTPQLKDSEYPTLRRYSLTWPTLEFMLRAARRHQVVHSFFETLFIGEILVPPSLEAAVDTLLDSLVTRFDDEELPLRRKERFNQAVIDVDSLPGRPSEKKAEASRRYGAEKDSLQEQTNFAAMLTNSAMYPERYGATQATQRYAVSRSREWIVAGFNDLIARDRSRIPADVEINSGSWKGTCRDGSEERQLNSNLYQHYTTRIVQAVNAVRIKGSTWAVAIIGGLIGLMVVFKGINPALEATTIFIGLLIMAGAGAFFYFQYNNLDKVRQQTQQGLEKERDAASKILKAALAELTDLRRDAAKEDEKAENVLALLKALSSPQFILKRPDQVNRILA